MSADRGRRCFRYIDTAAYRRISLRSRFRTRYRRKTTDTRRRREARLVYWQGSSDASPGVLSYSNTESRPYATDKTIRAIRSPIRMERKRQHSRSVPAHISKFTGTKYIGGRPAELHFSSINCPVARRSE